MSDSTIHVLSTRPLSPALIIDAAVNGLTIDVIPFIETAAIDDPVLCERLGGLGRQRLTALFTSSNAVEAVAKWVDGSAQWIIYSIGGATSQAVSRHFGEDAIAGTAASARELALRIIEERSAEELFFFCGDLRREELPSLLRQAGFGLQELVVYETMATPRKVQPSYEGILFFSPSAVESFFSANTIMASITLFAIGRTTAAAIREFCPNPIVVSGQPDATILIGQVIDHFKN